MINKRFASCLDVDKLKQSRGMGISGEPDTLLYRGKRLSFFSHI